MKVRRVKRYGKDMRVKRGRGKDDEEEREGNDERGEKD